MGEHLPKNGAPSCSTCEGLGIVATAWPDGYPHVTPCPECRPVGFSCGVVGCPCIPAIEKWKNSRSETT